MWNDLFQMTGFTSLWTSDPGMTIEVSLIQYVFESILIHVWQRPHHVFVAGLYLSADESSVASSRPPTKITSKSCFLMSKSSLSDEMYTHVMNKIGQKLFVYQNFSRQTKWAVKSQERKFSLQCTTNKEIKKNTY